MVDWPLGRSGRPEIRMRVEVDQRQRPVLCSAGTQGRQAGRVVAAEDHGEHSALDYGRQLLLNVCYRLFDVAGEDIDVAVVDDAQLVERRLQLLGIPVMGPQLSGG